MTSPAFGAWRSGRLVRLDGLLAAHPNSIGSATDPAVAQEWTEALVQRLASEFQGYCRDLHDDAVEAILDTIMASYSPLRAVLMNGLILDRGLDRRSADPKTIANDFARLGLDLWVALAASHPEAVSGWREGLLLLHRARNGVSHDDRATLAAVAAAGWPMAIGSVRAWRNLVDEAAAAMDDEVSKDIAERIRENPWEVRCDGFR
jgi:hypothetical protein